MVSRATEERGWEGVKVWRELEERLPWSEWVDGWEKGARHVSETDQVLATLILLGLELGPRLKKSVAESERAMLAFPWMLQIVAGVHERMQHPDEAVQRRAMVVAERCSERVTPHQPVRFGLLYPSSVDSEDSVHSVHGERLEPDDVVRASLWAALTATRACQAVLPSPPVLLLGARDGEVVIPEDLAHLVDDVIDSMLDGLASPPRPDRPPQQAPAHSTEA